MQGRIAIACSGLGHIHRGIESWAEDLGKALSQHGVSVTLFGGGATSAQNFSMVPCIKRTSALARSILSLTRHLAGWRYGAGSIYEVEQTTFSYALWRRIRHDFDILHVQDPVVAWVLERLNRAGLSRPRVILANGTGEPPRSLQRMTTIQQLSPVLTAEWDKHKPPNQRVFTIPNFVDEETFCPGDKEQLRRQLGIPSDSYVVLCAASIRKYHKRIDYLLYEFAKFASGFDGNALLLVAGGREDDTAELIQLGERLLGERVRFLVNVPRAEMPNIYRLADVFVLPSLFETFGIVLLEAMASGLPVICHDTATFRLIAGPAGSFSDLSKAGSLGAEFARLADGHLRKAISRSARNHVLREFSASAVIPEIIAMYECVAGTAGRDDTRVGKRDHPGVQRREFNRDNYTELPGSGSTAAGNHRHR